MKKTPKVILIVLGNLLAFLLLVLIAVSLFGGSIAKHYLNTHAEELIGRKAAVEHVGLNLFNGHLSVEGLTVYEDNGKDRFAGFDTLDIGVRLLPLIGQQVHVHHFTLSGLNVQVLKEGDRFNFSSLIEYFQSDSTEAEKPKDTTPSPWVISLHNIRFSNGQAHYADRATGNHWGFDHLSLRVPDFTLGGKHRTNAGLTLDFTDGGTLGVAADYHAATNHFDVGLKLTDFAIDQLKTFVVDYAHIDRLQGHLSIDATAKGCLDSIMDMRLSAQASLDDVAAYAVGIGEHAPLLTLHHFGVNLSKAILSQNLFDISTVELNGLTARYDQFTDTSNTLSRLLVEKEASTDTTPHVIDTTPHTPLRLHIGHVDLNDINFTYADHTLPDRFEFPITRLRLQADDFTSSGGGNARILASLPSGGMAIVDWKGTLPEWKQSQSLRLNVKGLHLSDLSPYMVAYFGMPFSEGIFGFTSVNNIRNSQLAGINHIDIYKPNLGDKRSNVKPRLHLPVRAALYILKDKDDKVSLPVPVQGNVDNPKFNYMKLVWRTLGNLIVKVATSPARALGNLSDNEDDSLFIPINAKVPDFTSEQYYQIDRVAEIASMDENLVLNLRLDTRPTTDNAVTASHEHLNQMLRHHLLDLGVPEAQLVITTSTPDSLLKQEGYTVTTTYIDQP